MKHNIILHITTSCNYNCSYCDVIKDKKKISKKILESILLFIENNKNYINKFKFFWWEPILRFEDIKYIIDNSKHHIGTNYEIVTNTTLLVDEVWEYFRKYFSEIFFSIDTENKFDYINVSQFILKYDLEKKIYFNLVFNPWEEDESFKQFNKLYDLGFRGFNILPVYFTKLWKKENLEELSIIMKKILDLSLKDNTLRLYWFQKKQGNDSKLSYNSLFINTDWKIYYSDIVSTYFWVKIKKDLFLWNIKKLKLQDLEKHNFSKQINNIKLLEEKINLKLSWQRELQKIMDYFSIYLNKKNAK